MRLRRDRLTTRIFGALVGLGFLAVGLFSALGSGGPEVRPGGGRALGFGLAAIVAGIVAVVASLTVSDLNAIWCRQPHRWGRRPTPPHDPEAPGLSRPAPRRGGDSA